MKNIFRKLTLYSVALAAVSFSSCSLEENNPAGFTKENLATSIEGYETLVNQCYFAMERYFYGTDSWMSLTEGDSDLWTYQANQSTSYTQWFGSLQEHLLIPLIQIIGGMVLMME